MLFDAEMVPEQQDGELRDEKTKVDKKVSNATLSSPNAQTPRKTGQVPGSTSTTSAKQ